MKRPGNSKGGELLGYQSKGKEKGYEERAAGNGPGGKDTTKEENTKEQTGGGKEEWGEETYRRSVRSCL